MNVVVIHLGPVSDCLVASSINRGLARTYDKPSIVWVVDNEDAKKVFDFSKYVKKTLTFDEFYAEYNGYMFDLLINLSDKTQRISDILAKQKKGLILEQKNDKYLNVLYGDTFIDMSLFQIYYRLAGMTWRGQGYDLNYYPKAKSKESRIGVGVADARLRDVVRENLNLQMAKLWIVPFKKSMFKQMDEINRCKNIITDDFTILHLALYLRKNVSFLKAIPINFNLEMFGCGRCYDVSLNYVRR